MNESFYSRRLFLTRGVQLLSATATLPLFLDQSARAMAAEFADNPQGAGRPDHVLVVLQLAGGNDGLNTVIPVRSDEYYRARPKLGIARKDALKLNDDLGLHPAATGLKQLYDAGLLTIVQGVGYPNPNRSHFRSTDIWQTAEPDKVAQEGWLGKYFDSCCKGSDPAPEPSSAIALVGAPPQTLMGDKFLPLVFKNPQSLAYGEGENNARLQDAFNKLNDGGMDPMMKNDPDHQPPAGADDTSQFLERSALNARVWADKIKKTAATVANKAVYPNSGLASDLKLVAQMIAAGLPTRVYYVSLGGFDTHSGQVDRHQKLMTELGGALAAFASDLKQLGQLERTTLMTFSEFGRRVAENGSGTDHGEAAPLFIVGGKTKAGLMGITPDLSTAKLHRGDVPFTTDFRKVYATMLREWLKADDARILGKKFDTMPIFA